MSTVAEQLRQAREAKNLTVEQVAEMTKLRTDHVRALEEGRFDVFSAIIYIRGSVKAYAKAMKLDEKTLLDTLTDELGRTEKFSGLPPLVETKTTFLDTLILLFTKLNWKVGFAGVVAIVVIIIAGMSFWAWRHHKSSDPLKNLPPAVYSPANSGDTLPLPKK